MAVVVAGVRACGATEGETSKNPVDARHQGGVGPGWGGVCGGGNSGRVLIGRRNFQRR